MSSYFKFSVSQNQELFLFYQNPVPLSMGQRKIVWSATFTWSACFLVMEFGQHKSFGQAFSKACVGWSRAPRPDLPSPQRRRGEPSLGLGQLTGKGPGRGPTAFGWCGPSPGFLFRLRQFQGRAFLKKGAPKTFYVYAASRFSESSRSSPARRGTSCAAPGASPGAHLLRHGVRSGGTRRR